MSLLGRRAPHIVLVQNRTLVRNSQGMQIMQNTGDPVLVKCMVEPVRDWSSVEETQTLGLQVLDLAVVRSKKWPGDINSHAIYKGSLYETVGAPQHYDVSPRTSHFRITLKWLKKVG
jgi:hypothetical protein